jgi:hypothetical protein
MISNKSDKKNEEIFQAGSKKKKSKTQLSIISILALRPHLR